MATIFDKWNQIINVEGLKKDIEEASTNSGEYREVPVGTYECEIEKMELKESKKGDPMVSVWFKILVGEYKNSRLFLNQVITQGFQIHSMNEFLKSLDAVDPVMIRFVDYNQYNNLLMDISEAIESSGLEYLVDYSTNKKGYNTYTIKEVYEA